mmetsp:Transcript_30558/g.58862  ORF Transcript_30558/g.58862 Transcript_30558/m.58862 type:complete len:217 (+) Transcript_30558:427-1077(+)
MATFSPSRGASRAGGAALPPGIKVQWCLPKTAPPCSAGREGEVRVARAPVPAPAPSRAHAPSGSQVAVPGIDARLLGSARLAESLLMADESAEHRRGLLVCRVACTSSELGGCPPAARVSICCSKRGRVRANSLASLVRGWAAMNRCQPLVDGACANAIRSDGRTRTAATPSSSLHNLAASPVFKEPNSGPCPQPLAKSKPRIAYVAGNAKAIRAA